MQATRFEYRFRFAIHAVIYLLGFTAPWLFLHSLTNVRGFTTSSTWLVLSALLARREWLTFDAATVTLLVIALLFTALGAWLRVWGSAYVGTSVVQSPEMHGETMLADGPYRRTRNPLYLGTLLHTVGVTILMPPSGALLAVVLLWVFEVRLALAEEPFLAARFGQPYLDYKAEVPRFLPAPTPRIAAAGARPRWLQALLGEIYFVAVFFVLAIFGWSFNAQPLRQGLIVSLGLSLVVRAFLPRAAQNAPTTA
jgi:protein-S-isoprenylcysteine O-methyltransferase Ste14